MYVFIETIENILFKFGYFEQLRVAKSSKLRVPVKIIT